MGVRVGSLAFAEWHSIPLGGGWSDTFVFPLSAQAGLSPREYAQPLRRMARQLAGLRPGVVGMQKKCARPCAGCRWRLRSARVRGRYRA